MYKDELECKEEIEKIIDFEFYKTLFEPVRSEILKYLAVHEAKSIKEISENFTQDRSVISRHLEQMYRCNIVNKKKISRSIFYELNSEYILKMFEKTTDDLRNMINYYK